MTPTITIWGSFVIVGFGIHKWVLHWHNLCPEKEINSQIVVLQATLIYVATHKYSLEIVESEI